MTDPARTTEDGGPDSAAADSARPPFGTAPAPPAPKAPKDEDVTGGNGKDASAPFWHRLLVVVWLLALTVPLFRIGNNSIRKLESLSTEAFTQPWRAPALVSLRVGPEAFTYDADKGVLTHRGPISKEQQEELRGLIQFAEPGDTGTPSIPAAERPAIKASFELAVDRLSFNSRAGATEILLWLLVVGGIFGASGSLARVYNSFLYVACYKGGRGFDLGTWWPYYVLLPALGFILGVFVTVLLKANLLTIEDQSPAGNLWWAGVSIIVGFGAIDVAERLKSVGRALFGSSKK